MTPRIVSLLPSATEIACALGFADALVGRSHECDFPNDVEDLPICTAPKYFNRPGPRLVETLEIAAEALHSGALAFGHEGIGWERMPPVS